MDYKNQVMYAMARVIDYIEQNLKSEIDISECARHSGYSQYHFIRLFKDVFALTPSDYIRKRRLSEIAKRITDNELFMVDLAFEYGFNSHANFVRAFKAEHNILPTEYKYAKNSLKLYEPFVFDNLKPFRLTPEIITLESICLTVYKSDENYPPKFWNKYNAGKLSLKLSGGLCCEDYGVSVNSTEHNRYYIGIKTENAKGDISGTEQLIIEDGLYAVFETPISSQANFVNAIHNTWKYIFDEWLSSNKYVYNRGYSFETYIEQSRTFSEKIYIPIKLKGDE